MKSWYGFGSEHSANLVIIGTFETDKDAANAESFLNEWAELAREKEPAANADKTEPEILDLFVKKDFMSWPVPADSHALIYDFGVEREGKRLIVTTEESDFAAFLKVMLQWGARIETYSAHAHKGTGYGRRT